MGNTKQKNLYCADYVDEIATPDVFIIGCIDCLRTGAFFSILNKGKDIQFCVETHGVSSGWAAAGTRTFSASSGATVAHVGTAYTVLRIEPISLLRVLVPIGERYNSGYVSKPT